MFQRTKFDDHFTPPGMCFGGGGGGGGPGDGVSPSAGPGAGPGAPGTGPSSNSDVGEGNVSPGAPGTVSGTGFGSIGNAALGMGMGMLGLSSTPIAAAATLGNAINGVTGFGGGTPGIDGSSPGGWMVDATGRLVPGVNAPDPNAPWNNRYPGAADPMAQPGQPGGMPGFPMGLPFPGMPGTPAPGAPVGPAAATTSNEEQALRQAQLELVQQQRSIAQEMLRRQNLLEPQLLQQQGYEQVTDADGNVIGYRQSQAALDQQRTTDEINNLMRTRTLSALRGELPVDPALERDLGKNRATLEATLRGNLGSGFATSTPGIEALADFDKRADELRYQSRRDQLTSGEGIRLAGEDINNRVNSSRFGSVAGLSGLPAGGAGLLSQAGAGLTPGLQNLLGGRQLSLQETLGRLDAATRLQLGQMQGFQQASSDQARIEAADNAGMGQLFGSLGSAALANPSSFGQIIGGIGSAASDFGGWLGGLFGG